MFPTRPTLTVGALSVTPALVLAPMAGVTVRAFRLLCRAMGAGLVCSEMVSATALEHRNARSLRMLATDEAERPVSLQIAAGSPETAAKAVRVAVAAGADVVDLNFGCPVPKVRKTGAGAVLLQRPETAGAIIRAAVRAAGPTPVTVKMRAGWDRHSLRFKEISHIAANAGVAAIALHARTAEQGYSGSAHWPWIAELAASVPVPVIGNGDVRCAADAVRMIAETGCAGVMIGRASLSAPWVFRECAAVLGGAAVPAPPDLPERLAVAMELAEGLVHDLGPHVGVLYTRKFLGWFSKGMPEAARFRERAHRVGTLEDIRALLHEYVPGLEPRCSEQERDTSRAWTLPADRRTGA